MDPANVIPAKRKPTPSDSDNTDTGSSMAPSRCRKRIPSEEWEKKRPIIARLYQEEKKSLKEVMEILERDYQFTATYVQPFLHLSPGPNCPPPVCELTLDRVKMYKSRIWKWGLDKKLKSDEVLAILILKSERDAMNKPSEFTIRGQPVDLDNINRYVRRNPGLVARFRAGQVPSIQTTLEVQCRTPSPSPGRSLTPPTESYRIEHVLGLFRNYVDGSFSGGAWDCEYNDYCVSHRPGDRSDELFERVIASFALVNRCMMRGDKISISAILNPAFESLKEIIATESPVFIVRTVCLLWYLDRHHKNDLLRLVMDYLAGLVPIVLGQHHIMSRIWRALGSTQFSNYYELSMSLYSVLVPLLEERIGPANYLTAILYGDHIDCVFSQSQSTESLAIASKYRARADATGKQHPWLTELAITQTALLCAAKEAEGLIGEAMECLQTLKTYGMSEEQEAVVNIQLGNYSYRIGDIPLAVRSYRDATRLAVTVDGDERLLLTCLANLESALSKQGKEMEAERVKRYRLKRLSDFAKESTEFANSTSVAGEHTASENAPNGNIVCGLGRDGEFPDWLWAEEDADDLFKAAPRIVEPMPWPELHMNPSEWSESVPESRPETTLSQYPAFSPLTDEWDGKFPPAAEWNSTCYG